MCSENNSVPGIWVSSNEVDEPGAYYTEWNKSEREKHILYVNSYMWNVENGTDEPISKARIEMQM